MKEIQRKQFFFFFIQGTPNNLSKNIFADDNFHSKCKDIKKTLLEKSY